MSKNSKYFIPMPVTVSQLRIGEVPSSLHPDHDKRLASVTERIHREEEILSQYGHPMVMPYKKAEKILKGETQ